MTKAQVLKTNYHYDAFISYNHNPEDIRIAQMLQQRLEHFRLPKGVKTKTGRKRIERVFLDKGELEAASDLTSEIKNALEHSDHLIIICSVKSRESIWVKREIGYFLEHHPKENILTVVTSGEPMDVLPETLLVQELRGEDGQIIREPKEPLFCDYRQSPRKANRTELPRIVAALLGCRYDEIVQRQRQYRRRKAAGILIAAAMAVSCALGYFIWSNHQIRQSYEQAMREESRNLALQSQEAMDNGDRIGAIRYALEALPSGERTRPVVSEAVMALQQAVGFYRTPAMEELISVREYTGSEGDSRADGKYIERLETSPSDDGKTYLMAVYANGNAALWNTSTGARIMADQIEKMNPDGELLDGVFCDESRVLLVGSNHLYMLDLDQEKIIWTKEYDWTYSRTVPGDSATEESPMLVSRGRIWLPVTSLEGDELIRQLAEIDEKSGKELSLRTADGRIPVICASEDGKRIAWICMPDGSSEDSKVCLMTANAERVRDIQTMGQVTDIMFKDERTLLVCGLEEKPEEDDMSQYSSVDLTNGSARFVFSESAEKTVRLVCWDTKDQSVRWDKEFRETFSGLPGLCRKDMEAGLKGKILCTMGDRLHIFDADGQESGRFAFGSNVTAYYQSSDRKNLDAVLSSGNLALCDTDKGTVRQLYGILKPFVEEALIADDHSMIVRTTELKGKDQSERILQYDHAGTDESWEAYPAPKDKSLAGTYDLGGFVTSWEDSFIEVSPRYQKGSNYAGTHILRRQAKDGKILWEKTYMLASDPDPQPTPYNYIGADESGGKLYYYSLDGEQFHLTGIDLESGRAESADIPLPETKKFFNHDVRGLAAAGQGKIYVGIERSRRDDPDSGSELDLAEIDPAKKKVVRMIRLTDLSRDESIGAGTRSYVDVEDGWVGVLFEDRVMVWDLDGKEKLRLETDDGAEIAGICGTGQQFLTVEQRKNQMELCVYDLENGRQEQTASIKTETTLIGDRVQIEALPEQENLLCLDGRAYILDAQDWSLRMSLPGYSAYNPQARQFYMSGEDDEIGHIPYHTLEDMVRAGEKIVEGK